MRGALGMSSGVKETICTNCEHRCVCRYIEKYLTIYGSITRVLQEHDIEFLKPVEPMCKYFKKKGSTADVIETKGEK